MSSTPEHKVKMLVKELFNQYKPHVWWFMPIGGMFSQKGVPDFVGSVKGRMFTVETKAPGKKPTMLQERCMRDIRSSGGKAFVVSDGATLLEVKKYIEETIDGNTRKRDRRVSDGDSDTEIRFWSDPLTTR